MKFSLILLSLLLFLTFCQKSDDSTPSTRVQLKQLTLSRNAQPAKWKHLLGQSPSLALQQEVALAIAQTQEDSLFPIVHQFFTETKDDSLKILAAFALAQLNHPQSEAVLIGALEQTPLSTTVQKAVVSFLANCGGTKTWSFLAQWLNQVQNSEVEDAIFTTLGILNRKLHKAQWFHLFDSTKNALTPAESYYLYRSRLSPSKANQLLNLLPQSPKTAQIFICKTLNRTLSPLHTTVLDSNHIQGLKNFLSRTLTPAQQNWHLLLAALPLTKLVYDSLLIQQVKGLTKHPIVHVRLAAYKTLSKIEGKKVTPFLVETFSHLPEVHEKAFLATLIAQLDPNTAYLLINKSLDKGTPYFKRTLLSALAFTRLSLSNRLLREFLKLDDPFLSNAAFSALDNMKRLHQSDVNALLHSQYVSNVGTALDWYLQKKKKLDGETWYRLYRQFRQVNGLEIQMTLCKILEEQLTSGSFEADSLRKYAAHPVLFKHFPQLFGKPIAPFTEKTLPKFLLPDSLTFKTLYPIVEIKTTKGTFTIRLEADLAPVTVKNFLHLTRNGFYNNLYFHRVVSDFVVQGGDPEGTGWGSAGYLIPSEHNPRPFERGAVGIATAGFDTGSCQFFICLSDQPHLNGNYTRFGKVINNMNVVDQIEIGDRILSVKIID